MTTEQAAAMWINGQWVGASRFYTSLSPVDGDAVAAVAIAGAPEVDAAVRAAAAALPAWKATAVTERARLLATVADLLVAEYGDQGGSSPLKTLITREVGKRFAEADIEVIETSDMVRYFATEGGAFLQPRELPINSDLWPSKKNYVVFEPVGVIAVIKPWNYPLELPVWAIAPALLGGNTVVFKPSEYSSAVGLRIAAIFARAGFPPGVLNVVTGDAETGRILVRHDRVDMVSFTGSVEAGRDIAVESAQRLRKYNLELGGNDAAIVLSDVDQELAANGLVWGAMCNSGQVCVGTKRAFVARDIVDPLTTRICEKVRSLRAGADYGPIVNDAQLKDVEAQVQDAVERGATVLIGGERALDAGELYFQPTVLTGVDGSMRLMKEECFGPVLPVIAVDNMEDAVSRANNSTYGLGASVWTSNVDVGRTVAERLNVGMVWVNDVNVAFAESPWGGRKQSGHGLELSEWGLYEFVEKKHISVELSEQTRRDWWYPYADPTDEVLGQ